MVRIKEIFISIQGEGPYVGYKQLFIRFCTCNLNCKYCDTDFDIQTAKDYTIDEIVNIINSNTDCHSVSFTGGEPLLNCEFLDKVLSDIKIPAYLETNGTLYKELEKIIDKIDYISADIKLSSCTGLKAKWEEHDMFFSIAKKKTLFAKMVFDNNISDEEIIKSCELCKKYDIELILQPMMIGDKTSISSDFMQEVLNKCLKNYKKVRLIPQVHKFINVI